MRSLNSLSLLINLANSSDDTDKTKRMLEKCQNEIMVTKYFPLKKKN